MKEGGWKARAKWNGIIYKRGGIVQSGDGGEGVSCLQGDDQRTKSNRLPTTASALTGESSLDTPDVSRSQGARTSGNKEGGRDVDKMIY